jgi:hypothetical protein
VKILLVLLVAAACGPGASEWDRGAARAPTTDLSFPNRCERRSRVYFLALDPLDSVNVEEVVYRYRDEFGMPVEALRPLRLDSASVDAGRHQRNGDALAQQIAGSLGRADNMLVIALTDDDLFDPSVERPFVFAYERPTLSIVSSARMRAGDGDAALHARLYKTITRLLGRFYCGFATSENPRSVLFDGVDGVDALDQVDEATWD